MSMQNETAIVTGSTGGIGKKIAELLLREGCKVVICSKTEENVQKTLSEFKVTFGDSVIGVTCDVSIPSNVKNLVEKAVDAFGSIRILVSNAGFSKYYGPFEYLKPESVYKDALDVIGVNLIGTINTIAAVLPQMKKQGYGRIITLTGGGADRPIPYMTIYSASKGGILAFSKCFAEELKERKDDIKINIFQPGMQRTGLTTKVDIVQGWKNEQEVLKDTELVLQYMGGNLEESCYKVIPFVLPSCKKNGKVFLGFKLFKLIRGAMKMQKIMKKMKKQQAYH
jgi:NAD(P)-dependent dehydrogenase (short-subunit alcohol dehydrogenase family)